MDIKKRQWNSKAVVFIVKTEKGVAQWSLNHLDIFFPILHESPKSNESQRSREDGAN